MSEIPKEVIYRYAYKNGLDLLEAEDLFDKLELFLDGAAGSSVSPSPAVDDAWHEFILHTRFYGAYCQSRYGSFVHHVPLSPFALDGEPKETGQGTKKCCGTGIQSEVDEAKLAMSDGGKCSTDCRIKRSNPSEEMSL